MNTRHDSASGRTQKATARYYRRAAQNNMASLLLLSGLGAPMENRPNQHQMVPTFPANNFKSCVSTAVEMKSQVCSNICNNADKFACPAACRCV